MVAEGKIQNIKNLTHNLKKTIIVTGGAGFLGSHLCGRLLGLGHSVICIDNLITGRMQNIENLESNHKFIFILHDVIKPFYTSRSIDEIYNLACPASPPKYQLDPVHTLKTCVEGSINMLELAREKNAMVLQASTSEVYGDPNISPQPESYHGNVNTVGPRSCYDEGKRVAETLFHEYHAEYGVAIKIARIFNTYGPNMDPKDGRVVSNFIMQALQGEDLTIHGEGEQTRSFCFESDLIDGLIALMEGPKDLTQPVNLGNPCEFTMNELAEVVLELTGSKSKIVYDPLPTDDPKQRRPDIFMAQQCMGWKPKISLLEGLQPTIAYFRQELEKAQQHVVKAS